MSTVGSGVHGETQDIPAETQGGPIIISRVINLFLILLYVAVLVVHVVCLAVLAAKRNEIVGKFEDDPGHTTNITTLRKLVCCSLTMMGETPMGQTGSNGSTINVISSFMAQGHWVDAR